MFISWKVSHSSPSRQKVIGKSCALITLDQHLPKGIWLVSSVHSPLSSHTLKEIQEKYCIQLEIEVTFNRLINSVLVMFTIQLILANCKVTNLPLHSLTVFRQIESISVLRISCQNVILIILTCINYNRGEKSYIGVDFLIRGLNLLYATFLRQFLKKWRN